MVRIIEFYGSAHAQSLHDPDGSCVAKRRHSHDFFKANAIEAVGDGRCCGFGGVSLPPIPLAQTPCYFDCWGERGLKPHARKPNSAYKWRNARDFDGPFTKPVLEKVAFRAFDVSVAFRSR
jgi:hypothetical protein